MDIQSKIISFKKHHPLGLPFLFLTEMWERFGFYIVQSLLIFYMIDQLGFSDGRSYSILGAFTALAYMLAWVGGFFADKILGFRKTVYIGGILLILGYILLAFPYTTSLFYALAIIVMGTGFLKPNISSLLGTLYKNNHTSRETGFTIFYIGIYLGIVLATTISGFIQQKFGWRVTFASAAIGLIIGMIIFTSGQRFLADHSNPQTNKLIKYLGNPFVLLFIILVGVYFVRILLEKQHIASLLLIASGCLSLLFFFIRAFFFSLIVRNKLLALLILFVISILFWAVYFQMFFSINLFIERAVNRHWLGIEIPPIFFIAIQASAVILFGIILAQLWQMLARRKKNLSIPFKFSLALLIISFAFLLLVFGIKMTNTTNYLVNPTWIIFSYILIAIAELLLSAIGLAAVTLLAPRHLIGTLMGIWFVSLGMGGEFAGILAKQAALPEGVFQASVILQHYENAFKNFALYALFAGIIALLLTPLLRNMAQGKPLTWRIFFR